MSPTTFSTVFTVFVAAAVAWRLFLGLRQARHVTRHRAQVPADFAELIPLEAHRKAADYTLDKQRVGLVETVLIDGAFLLFLTVGGGVAGIDAAAGRLFGDGHGRDLATVFGVLAVSTLASMPFDAYRTFIVEARHGFNRMTPALFVGDTLFAGSIGRTDLPGGDSETLLRSIREVLFAFPDDTPVYSGHGPVTTIGQEKRTNPFLS